MKITYGELPNQESCIKLTLVSFINPKTNLDVYKMTNDLKVYQDAFGNEQSKLLRQYGTPQADKPGTYFLGENAPIYLAKFNDLQETEIKDFSITIPDLSEKDFEERNCSYPQDKSKWLNGKDIGEILLFIKKVKEGKKEDGN